MDNVKVGDILLLKYRNQFIGFGTAIRSVNSDIDCGEGWSLSIPVNMWIKGKHVDKRGIQKAREAGTPYATVKQINEDFAKRKIIEMGIVEIIS